MALSDLAIKKAKPAPKPYKLADSGGLFLLVTPTGGKLWRLKYRHFSGEKTLSIGAYPTVTLAEARQSRDNAKKELSSGLDPSEIKRQAKLAAAEAAAQTFGSLAKEFIARQEAEGMAPATLVKSRWFLEDLATPLADRPIAQITVPEVLALLRTVEAKGNLESAARLRSAIGRIFRYAIVTGRATADPTAALKGALRTPKVRHQPALTDPARVGELLRAIDGAEGSRVVRAALQIMALCFPRPGELRLAQWSEIDLEAAVWTIPAERTKMRRPHTIPLAPQAVAILRDLKVITGRGVLAFPGVRRSTIPMSENTLNAALRRLGYSADEMTSHGFRTIASTLLNESGQWSPDAIERALAHQDTNAVRRAYARGSYWDERTRMAVWWADHLDGLRLIKPSKQGGGERLVKQEAQPSRPRRRAAAVEMAR
jgi:integrase